MPSEILENISHDPITRLISLANFRILLFKHFCYSIYVRPKGNWGTGEQRQKTLGKMGKGRKILVKQGVSTDRSPLMGNGLLAWYR